MTPQLDWLTAAVRLALALVAVGMAYVAFNAVVAAAVWLALNAPWALVLAVLAGATWIWRTR